MKRSMRCAWLMLFAVCALTAAWTNIDQQRILVLHEGRAEDATTKAFKRGLDARFQPIANLKVRYQYLGWDQDICKNMLLTLSSFSPQTVIAEGSLIAQCLTQAPANENRQIHALEHGMSSNGLQRFSGAWRRVLQDLLPPHSRILLVHNGAMEHAQQTNALSKLGEAAGFSVLSIAVDTANAESQLTATVTSVAPAAIIYLPTFSPSSANALEQDAHKQLLLLRQLTSVPIFSTRLDSLQIGADIGLEQAPEQRGELLAQAALQNGKNADFALAPYEMALGIRRDFSQQKMNGQLPAFYSLSATMAGFIYEPR